MSSVPPSSTRRAIRFFAFWLGLGVVLGPVVGFLSGARTLGEFERSVAAGVIFMLTIGLSSEIRIGSVLTRAVPEGSLASARAIIANVAIRIVLTLFAMLVAAVLVNALVFPG